MSIKLKSTAEKKGNPQEKGMQEKGMQEKVSQECHVSEDGHHHRQIQVDINACKYCGKVF